jgi:hypothetical protein
MDRGSSLKGPAESNLLQRPPSTSPTSGPASPSPPSARPSYRRGALRFSQRGLAGDKCDRQVFGEAVFFELPTGAISVTGKKISHPKSGVSYILQHLFNITQDMLVLRLAEVNNLSARHREIWFLAVHDIHVHASHPVSFKASS